MVPFCWRYNRVSTENYIYIISGFRKYICGKGGLGAKPPPHPPPRRSQRHVEISNKMESFPSYGFRIFFSLFLRPYYFLVPFLSHFIFFLHIKNQNIFLDKNPAPPPPPDNQMVSPLCHVQRRWACASAQSDQHHCCSLPRQYGISSIYISNFMTLATLAEQTGLSLTWSKTLKTGFLVTRLIWGNFII